MNCQCQGIEQLFSQEFVTRELERYRQRGPDKTTRMLTEAIKDEGVAGLTLLDIGGGVGAVQHELFDAGVQSATDVDASPAYISAAKSEAERRNIAGRVKYQLGNFVDVADEVAPADIVTLDRVICCFNDMEQLVGLSARRARKMIGMVYPRDTWWTRLGLGLMNFYFWLSRSSYRSFVYSTQAVESILTQLGFERRSYRQTLVWQVVVFTR